MTNNQNQTGCLFTIAAPSGAGKTSLIHALLDSVDNLNMSVSYTTRGPRPGEVDGEDYHFVDEATFQQMIEHDDFLEYATVFGYHYGTSKSWVQRQLAAGHNVILEIDWQGVRQIKQLFPNCQRIFILPPSLAILRQRLEGRGSDSKVVIENRLAQAQREISHYAESDFQVVNDDFAHTLANLLSIIHHQSYFDHHDSVQTEQIAQDLLG